MTLACEGAVYFATFAYIDADVSDGDRVGIGNSLLQIWNLRFGQDFDVKVWSKDFEYWNLIKICVRTCFFGKQNSTLGSVVPLAMFTFMALLSILEFPLSWLYVPHLLF